MDPPFRTGDRKETRTRVAVLYALLLVINAVAWIALALAAHRYALLLPLGITAFALGLRHAVDADHIAAIDATTRKMMHLGARPVSVGFFFSLGHSTIVFILSAVVVALGITVRSRFPAIQGAVGPVGTWVSVVFLFVIAAANAVVLIDLVRSKRDGETNDAPLAGGFMARLLRPALRLVTRSWHMYPVGVLFGLGFDTASEVALLGIAAASAAGGMPAIHILILPCLFAAGMLLVDTTEGVAMLAAYGWAFVHPSRKFAYNVNMTLLSMLISLFVAGAEALSLGPAALGYGALAIFAVTLPTSVWLSRG